MKIILVKGWMPSMIGIPETEVTEQLVKEHCVRAFKCANETHALMAYAECMADWSTLLDENDDIEGFCNDAVTHILNHDYNWLEEHFV
jgi:hypothetical protein